MITEKIELNSFRILIGGSLKGPDVPDKIERLGKMNLEEQKILARATQAIRSAERTTVEHCSS